MNHSRLREVPSHLSKVTCLVSNHPCIQNQVRFRVFAPFITLPPYTPRQDDITQFFSSVGHSSKLLPISRETQQKPFMPRDSEILLVTFPSLVPSHIPVPALSVPTAAALCHLQPGYTATAKSSTPGRLN